MTADRRPLFAFWVEPSLQPHLNLHLLKSILRSKKKCFKYLFYDKQRPLSPQQTKETTLYLFGPTSRQETPSTNCIASAPTAKYLRARATFNKFQLASASGALHQQQRRRCVMIRGVELIEYTLWKVRDVRESCELSVSDTWTTIPTIPADNSVLCQASCCARLLLLLSCRRLLFSRVFLLLY